MTTSTEITSASPAFFDALNPSKALKNGLAEALAQNNLALYFMYSEQPTEAECRLGIQVVDTATLPHQDRVAVWSNSYYKRLGALACASRTSIASADWQHAHEAAALSTGKPVAPDMSTALHLIPKGSNRTMRLKMGYYPEIGGHAPDQEVVAPYKWAFIACANFKDTQESTWLKINTGTTITSRTSGRMLAASQMIFDFRGGIPLTVGPAGSSANIWLGQQSTTNRDNFIYPDYVDVMKIYIPNPTS